MAQPAEVITGPETVEFRRARRSVRIARADASALGAPPEALAGLSEDRVLAVCRRSGVGYLRLRFDGTRWQAADRSVPLFVETEPNGLRRSLSARLHPLGGADLDHSIFGLDLDEEFSDPAAAYPDDLLPAYSYLLSVGYESLGRLADLLEGRFGVTGREHLDDRVVAVLEQLAGRGELGPHLPPGGARELLAGWCREAGVRPRWGGSQRRHEILRATGGGPVLEVVFWTSFGHRAEVQFSEAYREDGRRFGGTEYQVAAPLDAVPALAASFEHRLGVPSWPGRPDDRLIACFDAMTGAGVLDPGLPRRRNRDVVAEWMSAAGVAAQVRGHSRTERLLHVYRDGADCMYDLVLTMDATADISFTEKYEYLPRSGDAGRLYSYGVRTPYASMNALLAALEPAPATGDPEDRLTRCFRALVTGGELTGELGLREARDRVAAVFTRAGVPAEETGSQWINSD